MRKRKNVKGITREEDRKRGKKRKIRGERGRRGGGRERRKKTHNWCIGL